MGEIWPRKKSASRRSIIEGTVRPLLHPPFLRLRKPTHVLNRERQVVVVVVPLVEVAPVETPRVFAKLQRKPRRVAQVRRSVTAAFLRAEGRSARSPRAHDGAERGSLVHILLDPVYPRVSLLFLDLLFTVSVRQAKVSQIIREISLSQNFVPRESPPSGPQRSPRQKRPRSSLLPRPSDSLPSASQSARSPAPRCAGQRCRR